MNGLPAERSALLERLVASARDDPDVVSAALVGSVARGAADRHSDIDLALRLRPGLAPADAADSWTIRVRGLAEVADTLDIRAGPVLYRVFLLRDASQVDLSFAPFDAFRSDGGAFELLFGSALEPALSPSFDERSRIGWAWLYGLHARTALARGHRWQALQMLDGMREQLVALACAAHGLPTEQGRGADRLPPAELAALLPTVASRVADDEIARAWTAAVRRLEEEVRSADPALARRLVPALRALLDAGTSADD